MLNPSNTGFLKSHLHDEKGNRVRWNQAYEPFLAGALKVSQRVADWPYLPWVPFAVMRQLSRFLASKQCRVLEYGSGRSTVWLAQRSFHVVSIENSEAWHEKVSVVLKKQRLNNVDYRFLTGEDYIKPPGFADGTFDLIIIDGILRSKCLENVHGMLKAGGCLYLDNSDTDMASPDGDMRKAEGTMRSLAQEWSVRLEFYTGYCPGNLHPHQGALLRKPASSYVH